MVQPESFTPTFTISPQTAHPKLLTSPHEKVLRSVFLDVVMAYSQQGPSRRSTVAPWNSLSPDVGRNRIQCRGRVGLPSEREDDQDDVSSPGQAKDRIPDSQAELLCADLTK